MFERLSFLNYFPIYQGIQGGPLFLRVRSQSVGVLCEDTITMATLNSGNESSSSSVSLSDEGTKIIKLKDQKEKIFIEFMKYSNEYIRLRHQMHVNLARGHLNMARGTRSNINGMPGKFKKNRNILNKQEMRPLCTISQLIIIILSSFSFATAELHVFVCMIERDESGKFSLHQKGRKQSDTKQNKSKSIMRNRNKTEETKLSEEAMDGEIVDPLTWFGAIVPRPICIAQTDFKNSLNLLIEMANVKQRLDKLNSQWEQL